MRRQVRLVCGKCKSYKAETEGFRAKSAVIPGIEAFRCFDCFDSKAAEKEATQAMRWAETRFRQENGLGTLTEDLLLDPENMLDIVNLTRKAETKDGKTTKCDCCLQEQ